MSAGLLEMRPVRANGRATAYLHAGQLFVSAEPTLVTTILGSCVSVGLWDEASGIGGINHYLLDYPVGAHPQAPRFGFLAIPLLIERLCAAGANRRNLAAKIFGGASINCTTPNSRLDLGGRNVDLAMEMLERERIPILYSHVRGSRGRKLLFQTDDGCGWVKEL